MATTRDVALNIIAEIKEYQSEIAKIPGVTDKQAAKAGLALQNQLTKAQKEAAKQAQKAASDAAKGWQQVGSVIAGSLSADAIKAGAGAVLGYADALAASVLEAKTFSDRSGLATETIAGLRQAAEATGKSLADLVPPDLAKRIAEASTGSGEALKGFKGLGVAVTDANGKLRSADAVLRDTLDALNRVEDPTARSALAMQALGEKGGQLLSTLGSSDALDAFVAQADRFGADVGPAGVRAAQDWQRAQADLGLAMDFAKRQALDLVGGLEGVTRTVQDVTVGVVAEAAFLRSFFGSWTAAISNQFAGLGALLTGDIAEGIRLIGEGTGLGVLSGALSKAQDEAQAAAFEFLAARGAIDAAGDAAATGAPLVADFAAANGTAAAAAKQHADELARLNARGLKAQAELLKITTAATEDQLDAEGKIRAARAASEDQIAALKAELADLEEQGVDTANARAAAEVAAVAVMSREARDLGALRDEQLADELDRLRTLEESSAAAFLAINELEEQLAQERRDRFAEALDFVDRLGSLALDAFAELADRQSEAARDSLDDARDAVGSIREERAALTQQLIAEEDAIEAARIEARLAELDAELETAKDSRKARKDAALKAFKAEQQIAQTGIAFNTGVAVLKAFALFGPPPSPAGILSAAAAVAEGSVQAALLATQKPPQFHTGLASTSSPAFTGGPDERLAVLTRPEAVLTGRAADRVGRDNIDRMNRTGEGGAAPSFVLNFERRHVDTMVSRTVAGGGKTRQAISRVARSRPAGQLQIGGA